METDYPNKMQKKETVKAPVLDEQIEQDYTFPDYGIVIRAKTLAEAQAKLQEILNNKNND